MKENKKSEQKGVLLKKKIRKFVCVFEHIEGDYQQGWRMEMTQTCSYSEVVANRKNLAFCHRKNLGECVTNVSSNLLCELKINRPQRTLETELKEA